MWKAFVWISKGIGGILTIIGLASFREDVAWWGLWITNWVNRIVDWDIDFTGNEGRWIFTILGISILLISYRVPQIIWCNLDLRRAFKFQLFKGTPSPIEIIYENAKHFIPDAKNPSCALCRVTVRNLGDQTIKNVILKIDHISTELTTTNAELSPFSGLDLQLAGAIPQFHDNPPQSFCEFLHPGSECDFDVVRLVPKPGNHTIRHANHVRKVGGVQNQFVWYTQNPSGVIPAGRYKIQLMAQGDNIQPKKQGFEFWGEESGVAFRPIKGS